MGTDFILIAQLRIFSLKKMGKKIISCQNHLVNPEFVYSDIDLLFLLAMRKHPKKLRIFGSRIDGSVPVGSLAMERRYYIEDKKLRGIKEIDL